MPNNSGLLSKTGGCQFLFLSVFAFVLTLSTYSAEAGDAAPDQAGVNAQVRWTTKPVRVEPAAKVLPLTSQAKRMGDYQELIYVPKSVRVPDSRTFATKERTYVLGMVQPVSPQRVCKSDAGKLWACGLQTRMHLRNLIAGKQIACKRLSGEGDKLIVDCALLTGQVLVSALLREGSVVAKDPLQDDLSSSANAGFADRKGIWADAEFYAARDQN